MLAGASLWAAVVLAAAPPALQDRHGIDVHWDAPAGCPSDAEVRGSIAALLSASDRQGRITAIARVRREDELWSLRLWTVTPEQTRQRTLTHADCAALADATAYVVAVVVDPGLAGQDATRDDADLVAAADARGETELEPPPALEAPSEDPTEVTPTPSPGLAPSPPSSSPQPPARTRGRGIQGALGLSGSVAWQWLPRVVGGLELHGAVLGPRLRVELAARTVPPHELEGEAPMGVRFNAAVYGATLRVCARLGSTRVEVPLCGGVEAVAIHGRGESLAPSRSATVGGVAAVVSVPVRIRLGVRAGLRIGPELAIAMARPRFTVDGGDEVLRVPRLGGSLMAGVEFRLGRPATTPTAAASARWRVAS